MQDNQQNPKNPEIKEQNDELEPLYKNNLAFMQQPMRGDQPPYRNIRRDDRRDDWWDGRRDDRRYDRRNDRRNDWRDDKRYDRRDDWRDDRRDDRRDDFDDEMPFRDGQLPPAPMMAPPSFVPPAPARSMGVRGIRRCLNRFTFIWLNNGRSFWFFPIFIGRQSLYGFRWRGFGWIYQRINLDRIRSFQCF